MLNHDFFDMPEKIGVFLTQGFEEATAVYLTDQLRNAGLPVSVIGISGQPIRGQRGIKIEPDMTIGEIEPDQTFRLIIVSGGRQYITSSLIDPRVHKLLQQTIQKNGYIAPIARAKEFLADAGFFQEEEPPSFIISHDSKALQEFVDELIKLASLEKLQPDILQ